MTENTEYSGADGLAEAVWRKVERSFDKWGKDVHRRALFRAHRADGSRLDYAALLSMDAATIANDLKNLNNHCRHDTWEFEESGPEPSCGWSGGEAVVEGGEPFDEPVAH